MKTCLLIPVIAIFALVSTVTSGEQNKILVGVCGGKGNLQKAKDVGFDYVEMSASGMAEMSDADFESLLKAVKETGIPVKATNGFIPGKSGIRITGPDINPAKQLEYAKKCLPRLHKIGVKVAVLGSGGARRIPDGFSKEQAFKQMVDFCKLLAPVAEANEVVIAIEPLNSNECNFITRVTEALEVALAVNHPNIQVMADIYHMAKDNESAGSILKAGQHLRHIHIATPQKRSYPLSFDEFNYKPYFDALKQIGYTGCVSIEGNTSNFDNDGPKAASFLKEALK